MTIRTVIAALSENERLNFVLSNRIPRRALTRFMGWFSKIERPLVRDGSIAAFRLFCAPDLGEARKPRFASLHDCFIRELKELGYDHVPADELVSMRIHSVTTKFIKELKTLGYETAPVDQLVSMQIHGVTPDFIRRMKDRGVKDLSIEQLISLRIHGLDR